jgi:hypothetical protein
LPTAASKLAVQRFFTQQGQPLLEFERVTAPLATGARPLVAACVKFLHTDLPRITGNENTLVRLAEAIPNPVLASAVKQEVTAKIIVGQACGEAATTGRTLPTGAVTVANYRAVQAYAAGAHRLLAVFGIAV